MSDAELLHKAISYAKNFENFQDVLMAVSLHPEWLTIIPGDRKWAIIHHVILSGDVNNLEQLLSLQKSNKDFRLTTNTRDNETILEIANLRKDTRKMTERIQQLIKLDEMLNYAKDGKWDQCYEIVKENPSFANEKPPYRRFYLIHHMACSNAIEQFERFKQIKSCKFALTLRADRKKINVIAREEGKPEFAKYMETQNPSLLDEDDPTLDALYKPSEEAIRHTVTINALMDQKNLIKDLDHDLMGAPVKPKNRAEVMQHINAIRSDHEIVKEKSSDATLKAKEGERTKRLLDNLMCPLTMAYFIEPVAAADGFTYEESAIVKWLETNDRSPMTNRELPNKNLNPNNVIKSIMEALKTK